MRPRVKEAVAKIREQAYRDARCGAVMLPWSVEVCLEPIRGEGTEQEVKVAACE